MFAIRIDFDSRPRSSDVMPMDRPVVVSDDVASNVASNIDRPSSVLKANPVASAVDTNNPMTRIDPLTILRSATATALSCES